MKKFTIGLSLMALAAAGTAIAQHGGDHRGPDADNDGVVTRAEVQTHSKQMFARMDANKDGQLNEADREARRDEHRSRMFAAMDENEDGQITRAEFMGFERPAKTGERGKHHRMGGRGHHGGGAMMRMADTNNDGVVSPAEFTAGALQRFDRMDANSDGQITKEERQTAREQMRGKWREKMRDRGAT